jgi:hypothetical protein
MAENKMNNPGKNNNSSIGSKVEKIKKNKLLKIKITGPVAWLGYPFNIDQIIEMDLLQATELIDQNVAVKI